MHSTSSGGSHGGFLRVRVHSFPYPGVNLYYPNGLPLISFAGDYQLLCWCRFEVNKGAGMVGKWDEIDASCCHLYLPNSAQQSTSSIPDTLLFLPLPTPFHPHSTTIAGLPAPMWAAASCLATSCDGTWKMASDSVLCMSPAPILPQWNTVSWS